MFLDYFLYLIIACFLCSYLVLPMGSRHGTRRCVSHEYQDILTFTRVDYVSTLHHAASKIGGAWKRHR